MPVRWEVMDRTLKSATDVIRCGRWSEREHTPAVSPNCVLPIGFKSKVVSRRHCEFWNEGGQWKIKDVASSSGTFLNSNRLSGANKESEVFDVNDGDVIQLGVDFKGGEEVIFRCIRIRIECNRGWQKVPNPFNTSIHNRLLKKKVKKDSESDAASTNASECSICLNPVSPFQSVFVASCGHAWHFKCIRALLLSAHYPNFTCPNCRFVADLEANVDVDDDFEAFEEFEATPEETPMTEGDELAHTLETVMENHAVPTPPTLGAGVPVMNGVPLAADVWPTLDDLEFEDEGPPLRQYTRQPEPGTNPYISNLAMRAAMRRPSPQILPDTRARADIEDEDAIPLPAYCYTRSAPAVPKVPRGPAAFPYLSEQLEQLQLHGASARSRASGSSCPFALAAGLSEQDQMSNDGHETRGPDHDYSDDAV